MQQTRSHVQNLAVILLFCVSSVRGDPALSVHYVPTIANSHHPQLVYWFWQANTIKDHQYLNDVKRIAQNSPFDFAFITDRGADFYNFDKLHGPLAETVAEAHRRGVKIGLQLWAEEFAPVPEEKALALVTDHEQTLDAAGHAAFSATTTESRNHAAIDSRVLAVYAFRKTGEGTYQPGSLHDITEKVTQLHSDPATVTFTVDAGPELSGFTVFAMAVHYHNFPDLFADGLIQHFQNAFDHYKDIPFDGTALDEFGYMMIKPQRKTPFRDRFYGQAFAAAFQRATSQPLVQTLLEMRYGPADNPSVRIRAIDQYFDVLRQGPQRIELAFREMSKKVFGPAIFSGIHDTYHNTLTGDDIWRTGLNWWQQPRDYGQSDEDLPLPARMGLLVAHPQPVMFDQFYTKDISRFTAKAIRDARFDARIHYHGWNDTGQWGVDLSDQKFLDAVNPVEAKIRLLNAFDPASPRLPVLVVFGLPALLNWYPDAKARNEWDINAQLQITEKAMAVWDAGYRCALVPSDLIDSGQITLDAENHPTILGRKFDAVVYLFPQYAKPATLDFISRFTRSGGKLMLEGTATRDFSGQDISEAFGSIAEKAAVRGFDIHRLGELGVQPSTLADGGELSDGSIILTDLNSIASHTPKPFDLALNGHRFTGGYVGTFAIKTDPSGRLKKLACGEFSSLSRDGKVLLSLEHPADIVVLRQPDGSFDIQIKGRQGDNSIQGDWK